MIVRRRKVSNVSTFDGLKYLIIIINNTYTMNFAFGLYIIPASALDSPKSPPVSPRSSSLAPPSPRRESFAAQHHPVTRAPAALFTHGRTDPAARQPGSNTVQAIADACKRVGSAPEPVKPWNAAANHAAAAVVDSFIVALELAMAPKEFAPVLVDRLLSSTLTVFLQDMQTLCGCVYNIHSIPQAELASQHAYSRLRSVLSRERSVLALAAGHRLPVGTRPPLEVSRMLTTLLAPALPSRHESLAAYPLPTAALASVGGRVVWAVGGERAVRALAAAAAVADFGMSSESLQPGALNATVFPAYYEVGGGARAPAHTLMKLAGAEDTGEEKERKPVQSSRVVRLNTVVASVPSTNVYTAVAYDRALAPDAQAQTAAVVATRTAAAYLAEARPWTRVNTEHAFVCIDDDNDTFMWHGVPACEGCLATKRMADPRDTDRDLAVIMIKQLEGLDIEIKKPYSAAGFGDRTFFTEGNASPDDTASRTICHH